jgi:hypothetical protein
MLPEGNGRSKPQYTGFIKNNLPALDLVLPLEQIDPGDA